MRIVLAALLFTAACASPVEPSPEAAHAEGLSFDVRSDDHVAGTFTHRGATLRFDLGSAGADRSAWFRTAGGDAIVSSDLRAAVDTMSVLDGALVLRGTPDADAPETRGDAQALDRARALMAIAPELRAALAEAGVRRELFVGAPESASFELAPGDCKIVASWSVWGRESVNVTSTGPYAGRFTFRAASLVEDHDLAPSASHDVGGYWAGFPITVCNLSVDGIESDEGAATLRVEVR